MDWQIIEDGNVLLTIRIEDKILFFIIDNAKSSIIKSFDPWKDSVIITECQLVWLDAEVLKESLRQKKRGQKSVFYP